MLSSMATNDYLKSDIQYGKISVEYEDDFTPPATVTPLCLTVVHIRFWCLSVRQKAYETESFSFHCNVQSCTIAGQNSRDRQIYYP